MANSIDLATYVARFEADTSGIDEGFGKADANLKEKLGGMVNWSKVAVGGAIVGVVAGVGKVIKDGVQATATLDEQMSSFQATTGATGKEVEDMRKLAQDLYKTNTDSIEDIVATSEAMKQTMGLTTDEIEKSQQAMMDYAKTTGQNNDEAVKSIAGVGKAWDLTTEEMVGSTDMFKASSERFGTDLEGMQKAMQQLAPASKTLGLEFEETNGLLNMMSRGGLDASSAVTALNYAAKTVESPEQFKQMMEDIQAIEDPSDRTAKAIELFGARAGVAMSSVLDGDQSLEDFMITMDEAEGTVNSASDAFDDNFNVQLELAQKMFSGLVQEIGEKFMPIINDVLGWVMDNLPSIMETVSTVVESIGEGINFVIDIVKAMLEMFTDAETGTNEVWNAIKETISTVVDGIMSVVNSFIELFKSVWDKYGKDIIEFAKKQWESIAEIFDGAFKIITGIFEAFTALLSGDWKKFGEALKKIIDGVWTAIKGIFELGINGVSGIFKGAIKLLSDIATNIMNGIWDAFKFVWDTVIEWFGEIFDNLFEWFTGLKERFFNAGSDMFNSVWDGMKSIWSSLESWVSDKVSWLADKLMFWRKSQDEMEDGGGGDDRRGDDRGGRDGTRQTQYKQGTPFVPSDQLAFLHKGEAVIPAKYNPYNNNSTQPVTTSSDQHFHIAKLEFPNVRDAKQIEVAIGSLSTYANQWANRN